MSVEVGSWVWIPDEDVCSHFNQIVSTFMVAYVFQDYVLPGQVVALNAQHGKFKLSDGSVLVTYS
jgi:hypothetical protein